MKENQSYGFIESNYSFIIEPENGINDPNEFEEELQKYASKNSMSLFVEVPGMEPEIVLDGTKYICKLGDPSAACAKNPIAEMMHLKGTNRLVGTFLGYKWIYVYTR